MRRIVQHIKQSLSWKLSLGILLMAIPIFMLSIGLLFLQSKEQIKEEATKHASSVLNTQMQRIRRSMNIVETATDINNWEVTAHLNPDSILAYSRFIVMLNGQIDGCSISAEPNTFPKYGRNFSAYTVREGDSVTTVIEEPYEYFEKVWYKTPHLLGKPCWVVYYDESDSLELTLDGMIASYSKPLYNADKHFVGIISTDLSLIRLSKMITSETPYPDSYFMMTGEEGRYFVHPDSTQLFTHTIFSDADPQRNADIYALGHEMTTGKKGSMSVRIDGEPCLVCYQPVPGTQWSLALVCPEWSILRGYHRLNYIISPLIFLGLLLILLLCSVTVAHAIHPLNRLTSKVQRIAEGHYDEPIPDCRKQDEVGLLQRHFQKMQQSLSTRMGEMQQLSATLQERGEELQATYEKAQAADRMKTNFLYNMSDQMMAPIGDIYQKVNTISDRGRELTEEDIDRLVDSIQKQGGKVTALLNQLIKDSESIER